MDGTFAKPYDCLFDAIERAYELAAPYESATITIKKFTGSHFALRAVRRKYLPTNVDKDNTNLALIIRPLYCTDS